MNLYLDRSKDRRSAKSKACSRRSALRRAGVVRFRRELAARPMDDEVRTGRPAGVDYAGADDPAAGAASRRQTGASAPAAAAAGMSVSVSMRSVGLCLSILLTVPRRSCELASKK